MQAKRIDLICRAVIHLSVFLSILGCGKKGIQPTLQNAAGIIGVWLGPPGGCEMELILTTANESSSSGQYHIYSSGGCTGGNESGSFTKRGSEEISFDGINPSLPPGMQSKKYNCSYQISGDEFTLNCDGLVTKYYRANVSFN